MKEGKIMEARKIRRRTFLFGTALTAAGCAVGRPRVSLVSPNEKLNVAGIGVGGKGYSDLENVSSENIVALCDVSDKSAAKAWERFPNARRYRDYREMLDKEANNIDAVTVSTADHAHATAALAAMELGKHVYVQKPLTHSIHEARVLTEAARRYKVATQMGNQGHSGDGVRQLCEMIWSGAIGPVREAHIWTNRPLWPQGMPKPLDPEPVPGFLKWDLWLNHAPERPYNKKYAPFNWRGWWDFGCGALGDMGCHIMDPANWSLKLGAPTSVEVIRQKGKNDQTAPESSVLRYEFPARADMAPVTVYWYDGGELPPRPAGVDPDTKLGDGANGSLFIGDKGVLTTGCYGGHTRFLPEELNEGYTMPREIIPRIPNGDHAQDWVQACKGGRPACSNFDYGGPFTETVLLGNLALRVGGKLEWDSARMKVTNNREANQYVRETYRKGWAL